MSKLILVLLAWWAIVSCGLTQNLAVSVIEQDTDDPGEPLFLTPYIERGDIEEARRLARVSANETLQFESYAGFFTVNKTYDSNQFFWYFPSLSSNRDDAPVLIWLQGGPGVSSLYGLFTENGPITVKNGQLERREYHWAQNHHLIYIDNPVGAGFSFTMHEQGYCTEETQIGEQLYSTVTQFFQLFPELQKNKFFITGESYAGKYVPALAHTILKKNSTAKTIINLKGLIIGGAWINPESQDHFHVISKKSRSPISVAEMRIQNRILKIEPQYSLDWFKEDEYVALLTKNAVRKAIHVGDLKYCEDNQTVYEYLGNDISQSMAPWLSELLDYYPVVLYGGQNDHTVPYAGIVDFLRNHFNFTGADEYKVAKQYSWRVDGELAGCVRRARLLTEVYVLDATHFVPADQPKRALDMIMRVTYDKGFEQNEICSAPPPSGFK